jgi:hypothetical protein
LQYKGLSLSTIAFKVNIFFSKIDQVLKTPFAKGTILPASNPRDTTKCLPIPNTVKIYQFYRRPLVPVYLRDKPDIAALTHTAHLLASEMTMCVDYYFGGSVDDES